MIKMSYGGQGVNEKAFERLDEIERKKIEKSIDENRPNQVMKEFPDDKILSEDQAGNLLVKETGLDEATVISSIIKLIKEHKLITSYDTKNRLHIQKMKL